MADQDDNWPLLESVLEAWARRKWVALLTFAAVIAVFIGLAVWLPSLYRATATILVESPQVSQDFIRPSVTAEFETRIQRIRQEVMSRKRLSDLIVQLGLYQDLRRKHVPADIIIEQMRRDIDLDLRPGDSQMTFRGPTIAFAISYTGRDPETVAKVANVLASLYVDENSSMRAGQAASTAEFLKAELADVKNELNAQEGRASQFKLTHIGELPEQISANLAGLERLNTQLRLNGENQIRVLDRRERAERQLADGMIAAPAAPSASSPRAAQLVRLRQELSDLRRQFADEYPDVVRVRSEIAAIERQPPDPTVMPASATPPPVDVPARMAHVINDAQTELQTLKEEETSLRQAIAGYEQRVENVPKRHEQLQLLSRDYETTKERYDTLRKRYEDAQLAENLERARKVEQFRVMEPAVPPQSPDAPGRLRLLLAGFLLSIGLAVAVVLAAEKLDTSFRGMDDLRSFVRVPLLFSIPLIPTTADTRRQRRRFVLTAVAAAIVLALIVAGVRHVATGNERIVRLFAGGRA